MRKICKRLGGNGGVTLVELVVAAVILAVAVIAIVAVMRMGTDMRLNDYHRRQARSMIMHVFEETFPFDDCRDSYSVTVNGTTKTFTLNAAGIFTVPTPNTIPVIIDAREGNSLMGTMEITITRKKTTDPIAGTTGGVVGDSVAITVNWADAGIDSKLTSIRLSKILVKGIMEL